MHTAMVIVPHADDATMFCGGTLAKFRSEGWRVILVRVTDDALDSMDHATADEARRANTEELHAAAAALGGVEVVDLDFPRNALADVPLQSIRERIVYQFRKYRPYSVLSFDPYGLYETSMDHLRVAQAVEEAYWASRYPLCHPEHKAEGLEPFSVCEQWYFGRELPGADYAEDITDHLATKIKSVCEHKTMLRNLLHQYQLQLQTWGRRMPVLDAGLHGDMRPLFAEFLRAQAFGVGQHWELPEGRAAEQFRLLRFGSLEPIFQEMTEPLPDAEPGPARAHFEYKDEDEPASPGWV